MRLIFTEQEGAPMQIRQREGAMLMGQREREIERYIERERCEENTSERWRDRL